MTAAKYVAYADFFARVPGVLAFISVMGFWIEYLMQRGQK